MTNISFWLDPGCPWTWRTSRWLRSVAAERGIDIDWHVMSLEAAGLPRELAAARDDTAYDAAVRDSHARGQKRVGTESGSPVIAIDDGPGFFGPVVTAPPDGDDAERLLDALIMLSAVPTFSELKRAR
jgi:2-hydroxychromene-2-carboxylate isomerase